MGPSAKAGRHTDHSHGCGCPWARPSAHAWPRTAAACGSRAPFVTSKLPICQVHHRELHRSGNEIAWRRLNIDPLSVALKLWQQSRADGELFQSIGGLALRCPLPPGDRRQLPARQLYTDDEEVCLTRRADCNNKKPRQNKRGFSNRILPPIVGYRAILLGAGAPPCPVVVGCEIAAARTSCRVGRRYRVAP